MYKCECGIECTSKSGLTLHRKRCPQASNSQPTPQLAMATTNGHSYDDAVHQDFPENNHRTRDDGVVEGAARFENYGQPIMGNRMNRSNGQNTRPTGQFNDRPKRDPFDFGAFYVMRDHIPMLMDVNFAITVGRELLKHGSENRAVIAFAHKLVSLDYDEEDTK